MTKKQVLEAVVFLSIFLFILIHLTYVIRMNGDVKDIFNGFYAEDKDTLDVVMIGSALYILFTVDQSCGGNMVSPVILCPAMYSDPVPRCRF